MEQQTIFTIRADLKAKRDALSLCHEELKKDSDDWNKLIIILSLLNGMLETVKIQLDLTSSGYKLLPIFISSLIAIISSLIKFRDYPRRMEVLIQSVAMITDTLSKYRNHKEIDEDLIREYNHSLEKLETSIYPDIRRKYLYLAHKNLLSIIKIEDKYFRALEMKTLTTPAGSSNNSYNSDDEKKPNISSIFNISKYNAEQEETI